MTKTNKFQYLFRICMSSPTLYSIVLGIKYCYPLCCIIYYLYTRIWRFDEEKIDERLKKIAFGNMMSRYLKCQYVLCDWHLKKLVL